MISLLIYKKYSFFLKNVGFSSHFRVKYRILTNIHCKRFIFPYLFYYHFFSTSILLGLAYFSCYFLLKTAAKQSVIKKYFSIFFVIILLKCKIHQHILVLNKEHYAFVNIIHTRILCLLYERFIKNHIRGLS